VFLLRVDNAEVKVPEADVERVSFLLPRLLGEMRADPVLGIAFRVGDPENPLWARRQLPAEGVFFLPGEHSGDVFLRTAARLKHAEHLGFLSYELITRWLKDGKPQAALDLLAEAESAAKSDPDRAYVFGIMRIAMLTKLDRRPEAREAGRIFGETYPKRQDELEKLARVVRWREGAPTRPLRPPRER
jgi:hypothetical protein